MWRCQLECKAVSIGGSNGYHALSGTTKGLAGVREFKCSGDRCYRAVVQETIAVSLVGTTTPTQQSPWRVRLPVYTPYVLHLRVSLSLLLEPLKMDFIRWSLVYVLPSWYPMSPLDGQHTCPLLTRSNYSSPHLPSSFPALLTSR